MEKVLSIQPFVHSRAELINVDLGPYTEVGPYSYLENVTLGAYSYCGQFCLFQNAEIGKFANIAAGVRIGPTRHPIERPTLHHFTYRRAMYDFDDADDEEFFEWRAEQVAVIGHDTWIGHGAVIMPNVTVGVGSVVGAGAVVTRDVVPYTVVAGVPARTMRERFPRHIADRLMGSEWWDWPHEVIKARLADFTGDVQAFVDKYGRDA